MCVVDGDISHCVPRSSGCPSKIAILRLCSPLSIRFDHDAKVPGPESLDRDDVFGLFFGRQHPALSTLSLKSLRPWAALLSETLTTLTLASLYQTANDLYPCLKAVPNLTFLALLNVISALSDDYTGSDDPIPLDRLRTLYVHQPGGPYKHFRHLMSHLAIPRPSLACILMGECDTLDDDFTSNPTQPTGLQVLPARRARRRDLHTLPLSPDRRSAADLRRRRRRRRGGRYPY